MLYRQGGHKTRCDCICASVCFGNSLAIIRIDFVLLV